MLLLFDPRPDSRITDPVLRALVAKRYEEICAGEAYDPDLHGHMIVVEPGDTVEALEAECGVPILRNLFDEVRFGEPGYAPSWEYLGEMDSAFEMVFILSDDGSGVSVFVPKVAGIDPQLLAVCQAYATPALASS